MEKNEKLVHWLGEPPVFDGLTDRRSKREESLTFFPSCFASDSVYKVKRTFDHYYWWAVKGFL